LILFFCHATKEPTKRSDLMSSFKNKQGANKKSRLNINFKHLYASVKARKTRLDTVEQYPKST
jgi:hypothetical protein